MSDIVRLKELLSEAMKLRMEYDLLVARAGRLLDELRSFFNSGPILTNEIAVPVDYKCGDEGSKHILSIDRLTIYEVRKDGRLWKCGPYSPIEALNIIFSKAPELIEAVERFKATEKAKIEKVREYLDMVEEVLEPLRVVKKLKGDQ